MADIALIVSEPGFLSAPVPGGVQVCTAEYVALFQAGGFDTRFYPITARRDLPARAAIRLGVDVYGRYDVEAHAAAIAREAASSGAAVIALNQMDIAPLAARLRGLLPGVPIVMLSHGNSSGDFLHESIAAATGPLARLRSHWRMGALLSRETAYFGRDLDLVLCLSETDEAIARWLGARDVLVVPRTFRSDLLEWRPVSGRIGCVATVDHFPNRAGLERLAMALGGEAIPGLALRLVGGGAGGAAFERRFPFVEYLGPLHEPALRAEASTWSLFVNPLFWHARGASTKLATAVSWGLPVVTTPQGRRGYRWSDGELPEAAEPAAMARLIASLLPHRDKLEALRAAVLRIAASGPVLAELGAEVRHRIGAASERRASGEAP